MKYLYQFFIGLLLYFIIKIKLRFVELSVIDGIHEIGKAKIQKDDPTDGQVLVIKKLSFKKGVDDDQPYHKPREIGKTIGKIGTDQQHPECIGHQIGIEQAIVQFVLKTASKYKIPACKDRRSTIKQEVESEPTRSCFIAKVAAQAIFGKSKARENSYKRIAQNKRDGDGKQPAYKVAFWVIVKECGRKGKNAKQDAPMELCGQDKENDHP